MTCERTIRLSAGDAYLDTRDFDYGVGDDLRTAEKRLRAEIARRIRQAARVNPAESRRETLAYELAALIAEGEC